MLIIPKKFHWHSLLCAITWEFRLKITSVWSVSLNEYKWKYQWDATFSSFSCNSSPCAGRNFSFKVISYRGCFSFSCIALNWIESSDLCFQICSSDLPIRGQYKFTDEEKQTIMKDFKQTFPLAKKKNILNFLNLYDRFAPNATDETRLEGMVCFVLNFSQSYI